jgi:hypothetical protein
VYVGGEGECVGVWVCDCVKRERNEKSNSSSPLLLSKTMILPHPSPTHPSGQVKEAAMEKEGLDSQLANTVQKCSELQIAVTEGEDARRLMAEKMAALQQVCICVCACVCCVSVSE